MKDEKELPKPFGLELLEEVPADELESITGGRGKKGVYHTMAISVPIDGHHHADYF